MYNEELHAESSLDTVWVIICKDGEVVGIGNKHGRESKKNFGRKTRRKVKSLDN